MKKKIYLINPLVFADYFISRIGRCVTKTKADYLYPPIELITLAAFLRKHKFEVSVIDGALLTNWQEIKKQIKNPKFFILMVGVFSFKNDTKFIRLLKKSFPDTPVIIFGQGASTITEDYLDYTEYAINGEPEKPILNLLDGKNHSEIKGLSYKLGKIEKINKKPDLIANLDDIPIPARDLINNQVYHHAFFKPYTMVYSARGCPFRCTFCTSYKYSPQYRVRSVDNVIKELKEIYFKYKVKNFGFNDETFVLNKNRVIEICKRMIKEKLKMHWLALGRCDIVDERTLIWMKRAGCEVLLYGIESADQGVLDSMNKKITIGQIEKAIKATKKVGIKTHGFFVFGSPADTKEKIEKTIDFAKNLKLGFASFNIFVPYPDTNIFNQLKSQGLIKTTDWSKYDQSLASLVFKHPTLRKEEIQKLIKKAYRCFYFSPDYIFRRLKSDSTSPLFLKRNLVNSYKIFNNFFR